jgi:hypothetical protein
MKMLKPATFTPVCVICLAFNARADATYDYTGAAMSGTQTGYFGGDFDFESLPYCCMALDGSLTLSSPLAPNLIDSIVVPVAMTFNIGGQTEGGMRFQYPPDPTLEYQPTQDILSVNTVLFANSVEFSTDSVGAVIGWSLSLNTPYPQFSGGSTAFVTSAGDREQVAPDAPQGTSYAVANTAAGTWIEHANAAPEIDARGATAGLTLLVGLIAVLRGRRKPNAWDARTLS